MTRSIIYTLAYCTSIALALAACQPASPPQSQPKAVAPISPLVALTPTEYNNTIRDLFGMPDQASQWPIPTGTTPGGDKSTRARWPWIFPPENGVEQFEGMAVGQATSPYQIEQLQLAASYFSGLALQSKIFFTCEDWANQPADKKQSCAWESIQKFAQRAWRRPITEQESQRIKAFFDGNWKASPAQDAIKLTVSGLLQSATFLYRFEQGNTSQEAGQPVALTSWEVAARLSYFLWDSMPDATLFQAAAENKLQSAEQVAAQARRMLEHPQARHAIVHFHNQLLGMANIHTINPSRELYGPLFGFTPKAAGPKAENDMLWPRRILELRQSMLREVELFVERTVFDGAGTLRALLTDNHGYMSSQTRSIYGAKAVELPGPKIAWESAPVIDVFGVAQTTRLLLSPAVFPKSERAGLLTMPAVLALYSHPVHPSPILRGKFILHRLACQPMPAPPASAFGTEPPDTPDAQGTNRERTEQVTRPEGCISCHRSINPPGFALEHYDSLGRWRDKDNGKDVNARTTVLLGDESFQVTNPIEFAQQLSTSKTIQNCYTLRWLRYALGEQINHKDPGVKALQDAFQQNDNVKELLISIASSDLFRYRKQGGTRP